MLRGRRFKSKQPRGDNFLPTDKPGLPGTYLVDLRRSHEESSRAEVEVFLGDLI